MRNLIRLIETWLDCMVESVALEGWWIKPDGGLNECEHHRDWHHVHIALDDFPPDDGVDNDEDSGDDGGYAAISAAKMSGWIHGSYIVGKILSIGWQVAPTRAAKNTLLAWMREHATSFPKIEIYVDHKSSESFATMREAIGHVRKTLATS